MLSLIVLVADIGNGACNGISACRHEDEEVPTNITIADGSCNSLMACFNNAGSISNGAW